MTQERDRSGEVPAGADSPTEAFSAAPAPLGRTAADSSSRQAGASEQETESFDSIVFGRERTTTAPLEQQPPVAPVALPPAAPVELPPAEPALALAPREPRSKRPLKIALIAVAGVILLLAAGFFGLMAYDNYKEQQAQEILEQQEQQEEREKAEAIKEAENPFAVLVGEVDPPSEAPLEVTVENDQLRVGASTLSFREGTLTPPVNGCSLGAITDLCLGARAKLGDGDFDVLAVKDISRTRFLDDPVEFAEFEGGAGITAASLAIDMANGEAPARFGALTANGTTGFILIFPEGTSADRVEEVLRAATVI